MGLRFAANRMNPDVLTKIRDTIPNRIKYFDDAGWNWFPFVFMNDDEETDDNVVIPDDNDDYDGDGNEEEEDTECSPG